MQKPESPESTLDAATLEPDSLQMAASTRRVLALTIAAHPDLARVGERHLAHALTEHRKLALSRSEPSFGDSDQEPLRDPYLGRDPVTLMIDPGGLRVDARNTSTRVSVDGQPVETATWAPLEDLERGIVIELGGRVVLVVHWTVAGPAVRGGHGMLGGSAPMLALYGQIELAASHPGAALLRGPSGAGKELVARAIHAASPRANEPFVAVNMAAIPASTAAAELFGHHRGAFTGAQAAHGGWFGQAERGTLFLDEIAETPDAVQPMLLRVLETGEVQPVGGQGVRRSNVRVLAGTDGDLEALCQSGRFRFPLWQRLAGQTIRVPALRERRADQGALLVHFLGEELGEELERLGTSARPWLDARLVARLLRYDFPGNVRELRNCAREIAFVSRQRSTARLGPTFEALLPAADAQRRTVSEPGGSETPLERAAPEPAELGDQAVLEALRANRFRVAATARALGISKNTLYQVMERCEGVRKARDLSAEEIEAVRAEHGADVEAMAERLEVSARGLKLRMRELGLG